MNPFLKAILDQLKVFVTRYLGYNIFISYSRKNGLELATSLEKVLSKKGFSVFRDERSLEAGDPYEPHLLRHCSRAKMMVTLLSLETIESKWVNKEISTRLTYRKKQNKPPNLVPIYFKGLLTIQELPPAIITVLKFHGFSQNTNDTLAWDPYGIADQIESQFTWWRWRQLIRTMLAVTAVALVVLALFVGHQMNQATQNKANSLANKAFTKLENDHTLALSLALEAIRTDHDNINAQKAVLATHHKFGRYKSVGNHDKGITDLFYEEHLDLLVSSGLDKKVKVWNFEQSVPLLEVTMPGEATKALVTRDQYVIGADETGHLIIWNLQDTVPISKIRAHSGRINDLIYLEEVSAVISAGTDSVVRGWKLPDLQEEFEIQFGNVVRHLDALSDKQWIAGTDQDVKIFQFPESTLHSTNLNLFRIDLGAPRHLRGLKFFPGFGKVIAHDAYSIVIVDIETKKTTGMEIPHSPPNEYGSINKAIVTKWEPEELICSMDQFGSLRFYEFDQINDRFQIDRSPLVINQHEWNVLALEAHAKEKAILSGGDDGLIRWTSNWGQGRSIDYTLNGHISEVTHLLKNPNKPILFSADSKGNIKSWNLIHPFRQNISNMNITCISESQLTDNWYAGTQDGSVLIFDSLHQLTRFEKVLNEPLKAIVEDHNFLYLLSTQGVLSRIKKSSPESNLIQIDSEVKSLVGMISDKGLAFTKERSLFLYDNADRQIKPWLTGTGIGEIHALDRQKKYLAFISEKKGVGIVDIHNSEEIEFIDQISHNIKDLAFSPDGKSLAVVSDGNIIHLYSSFTGKVSRREILLGDNQPRNISYLENGFFGIVGSQGLRLYSASGEIFFQFPGTEYEVVEEIIHDQPNKRLITLSQDWLSIFDYDPYKIKENYDE